MPARLLPAIAILMICGTSSSAAEPLHERIDAIIEARAKADGVALASPSSDGEFLRRAYLDLAGTLPPIATTKAFLGETSPDKRTKLIDELLNAQSYSSRMANLFHVVLMERLGDNADWMKYLRESFAKNKPYHQLVREILRADPADIASHGSAYWLSKRLENYGQNPVDYSGLTRDVGRLFLGKNFQCCECHDHLFIDDYKQKDFQGLHAFLRNAYLVNAARLVVGEKPTTEKLEFVSVFTRVRIATAPALPGMMMLELPSFAKGTEYATPPNPKVGAPGVLKFSTLAALSEQLPRPANRDFTRNAVNRLWFAFMGRGLVHPLDLHHGRNPASHPELLDLLATEFAARDCDVKWLVRELLLTKTYQRSSLMPAGKEAPDPSYFAAALERRLGTEQLLAAMVDSTGNDPALAGSLRPRFLKAFANQAREAEDEIAPSLKAALFLLHDEAVLGLLEPKPGNLVQRAARLDDAAATEELYLSILCRKPTEVESAAVARLLARHRAGREGAIGRVAWALLASMEFGVNH
jgi:hypothetical protein